MAETGEILDVGVTVVVGGVDTHLDTNMAAALNGIGGELGVKEFPTTAAGYGDLLAWLQSFGIVARVGVEGSGSYGTGLARYLGDAGVTVVAARAGTTGPVPG
jgi:transposase